MSYISVIKDCTLMWTQNNMVSKGPYRRILYEFYVSRCDFEKQEEGGALSLMSGNVLRDLTQISIHGCGTALR